jgi:hypothetical protein
LKPKGKGGTKYSHLEETSQNRKEQETRKSEKEGTPRKGKIGTSLDIHCNPANIYKQ